MGGSKGVGWRWRPYQEEAGSQHHCSPCCHQGDTMLQQSPACALWCCGAPWDPAWSCVTLTVTAPGPPSVAPLAVATSANHPLRVKPPVGPRLQRVPSLLWSQAQHPWPGPAPPWLLLGWVPHPGGTPCLQAWDPHPYLSLCVPVRPGLCPPMTDDDPVAECLLLCLQDKDCPPSQKCCLRGCGRACVPPLRGRTSSASHLLGPSSPEHGAGLASVAAPAWRGSGEAGGHQGGAP